MIGFGPPAMHVMLERDRIRYEAACARALWRALPCPDGAGLGHLLPHAAVLGQWRHSVMATVRLCRRVVAGRGR